MVSAPNLIFTNASTDPYSSSSNMCKWNYELMNVLHGGNYGVTDGTLILVIYLVEAVEVVMQVVLVVLAAIR